MVDTATVLKIFYTSFGLTPLLIPKEVGFKGLKAPDTLPSWLTEDYIDYCVARFNQTGFTGGLNYYRAMDLYAKFLPSNYTIFVTIYKI